MTEMDQRSPDERYPRDETTRELVTCALTVASLMQAEGALELHAPAALDLQRAARAWHRERSASDRRAASARNGGAPRGR